MDDEANKKKFSCRNVFLLYDCAVLLLKLLKITYWLLSDRTQKNDK